METTEFKRNDVVVDRNMTRYVLHSIRKKRNGDKIASLTIESNPWVGVIELPIEYIKLAGPPSYAYLIALTESLFAGSQS